jgi:hypothetical protein
MDLKELGGGGSVDWIQLVENRVKTFQVHIALTWYWPSKVHTVLHNWQHHLNFYSLVCIFNNYEI